VLKKDGFIVMFGRGTSFYRWNTRLADLGFKFKEEVIWNKRQTTSPVLPLGRVHESISINSLGNAKINSVKVDFFEKYEFEPRKIKNMIERITNVFGNRKSFDLLKKYYDYGYKEYNITKEKFNVTRSNKSNICQNRTVACAIGLEEGIREQSIIIQSGDHYTAIHPTQKPVRLLERLLNLVSQEGDLVLDPFSGSGSTAVACINLNRNYIGFEIDEEYFNGSVKRVFAEKQQTKLLY
jgi:site-specific DNA-methyltransferase (adenine-specific)